MLHLKSQVKAPKTAVLLAFKQTSCGHSKSSLSSMAIHIRDMLQETKELLDSLPRSFVRPQRLASSPPRAFALRFEASEAAECKVMLARSSLRTFRGPEVCLESLVQVEHMELEVDQACSRVGQVNLRLIPMGNTCVVGCCRGRPAPRIARPCKMRLGGWPSMRTVHQAQVGAQESLEEFGEMYMRRLRGGREAICEGCVPRVPVARQS